jgi:hypothetical protein
MNKKSLYISHVNQAIQHPPLSWHQPYCAPGEFIAGHILEDLTKANHDKKDFKKYKQNVARMFNLNQTASNHTDRKTKQNLFLAGFIEGEGSLNISAKKNQSALFGVALNCEFSLTQHVNGVSVLYDAMEVFQTGRLSYKSGSKATMVYQINNRLSLQKVVSFWEKYISPYGCLVKTQRMVYFKYMLNLFELGAHKHLHSLSEHMLPIWDRLRMQKGQSNETFSSLEEAQEYVRNFSK